MPPTSEQIAKIRLDFEKQIKTGDCVCWASSKPCLPNWILDESSS